MTSPAYPNDTSVSPDNYETLLKHFIAFCCLQFGLFCATAVADSSLSLSVERGTAGPGKFAAEEIRREALAHGMTLGDGIHATRVELTVEKTGDSTA